MAVGGRLSAGDGVNRIDVGGQTLMPGLIDAHIHALFTTVAPGGMLNRPTMLLAMEGRGILERMLRRGQSGLVWATGSTVPQ